LFNKFYIDVDGNFADTRITDRDFFIPEAAIKEAPGVKGTPGLSKEDHRQVYNPRGTSCMHSIRRQDT
jgi:hypothetical protein